MKYMLIFSVLIVMGILCGGSCLFGSNYVFAANVSVKKTFPTMVDPCIFVECPDEKK